VLVINSYTRWGLEELMTMQIDELVEWMDAIPKVYPRQSGR
jgi:hypothetical protein